MGKTIILLLFLSAYCTSCNPQNSENDSDSFTDADITDMDDLKEDFDIYDEESEADIEAEDDFDEIPDISYPDPTCIEVYEGDPESELCFGPVKTDVKCNKMPEDGEYTIILDEDNPIGSTDKPMDINDDFVFFTINPKNKSHCFGSYTYCPNTFACSRIDGYLYEVVTSKFIINAFSVDSHKVAFVLADQANLRNRFFMGNLTTNELIGLSDWGDGGYGAFNLNYSFLTYVDYRTPHILNLETNETTKLNWLNGPFPRNDGKSLTLGGRYVGNGEPFSESPFGVGSWIVDMETLETRPLNVTASSIDGLVYIDGDYAFIESGRDTVYYANFPEQLSGMDVYAINLKTKHEEKFTPEFKGIFEGNSIRPSFEYPYLHYVSNEDDSTYTGGSFAYNIETKEVISLLPKAGDRWLHIKDRYVMVDTSYTPIISKLPDLPKEHDDSQCEDDNICTDDRYFVTDGKCHFIPNHERCDDGDESTKLDVCVEGTCQGFAGTGTTDGMVEISSGSFSYDGLEHEIDDSFHIDVFEVTNSDYAKCVDAKACVPPLRNRSISTIDYYGNPLYDNYPVIYVNQPEAQIYCNWLGKRLPTEFEWMKATWDGEGKTYLWGEEEPDSDTYPQSFYANTTIGFPGFVGFKIAEIGTFPEDKTVDGIMDMSGNVGEWTTSEWTYDLCDKPPCVGYFGSDLMVVKGGGYLMGPELKARHPYTPWTHSFFVGFRCVKSVKGE